MAESQVSKCTSNGDQQIYTASKRTAIVSEESRLKLMGKHMRKASTFTKFQNIFPQ